jgi:nitroreductase
MSDISHIIRSRRSVKPKALDHHRPVERALIESVLTDATWAPTHGGTEPWRFIIFTDEARTGLNQMMPQIYDQVTPLSQVRPDKREKLTSLFTLAPVVIAIGAHAPEGKKISPLEEKLAVACAVQNLHLSAHAAGLAGMWSTPPFVFSPITSAALGFDAEVHCLGFFFLGWPDPAAKPSRSQRRPLAERVVWRTSI